MASGLLWPVAPSLTVSLYLLASWSCPPHLLARMLGCPVLAMC